MRSFALIGLWHRFVDAAIIFKNLVAILTIIHRAATWASSMSEQNCTSQLFFGSENKLRFAICNMN
jgi:uncharacterized membrane protein YphA (DoxX/SURF4 family)